MVWNKRLSTRLGSCLHRSSCHGRAGRAGRAVAGSLRSWNPRAPQDVQPVSTCFPNLSQVAGEISWLVITELEPSCAFLHAVLSSRWTVLRGGTYRNNCEHVIEFQRYHAISKGSKILRHEANFCCTYSQPTGSTFMVPAAPHTDVQLAICSEPLNLTR